MTTTDAVMRKVPSGTYKLSLNRPSLKSQPLKEWFAVTMTDFPAAHKVVLQPYTKLFWVIKVPTGETFALTYALLEDLGGVLPEEGVRIYIEAKEGGGFLLTLKVPPTPNRPELVLNKRPWLLRLLRTG